MISEFLSYFFKDYHTFTKHCQLQQPNPVNPINNYESEGRGNRMGMPESTVRRQCAVISDRTSCFHHYVIIRRFEAVLDRPDGVSESTWFRLGQLLQFVTRNCDEAQIFAGNMLRHESTKKQPSQRQLAWS